MGWPRAGTAWEETWVSRREAANAAGESSGQHRAAGHSSVQCSPGCWAAGICNPPTFKTQTHLGGIAGWAPDHHSQASPSVKWVVIFLLVEGPAFNLYQMQHLWSTMKWGRTAQCVFLSTNLLNSQWRESGSYGRMTDHIQMPPQPLVLPLKVILASVLLYHHWLQFIHL